MSDASSGDDGIGRVLVAGATGKTGRHVLDVLRERGYDPVAFTRSTERANHLASRGVETVTGDLLNERDVERAVEGVDAAITCVGSTPWQVWRARLPGAEAGPFVDGAGNATLARAADDVDLEAIAMCSSLGVGDEAGSWMGTLFDLAVGPVQVAKGRAEEAVRAAGPRHTILRPGALLDRLSVLSVGTLRTGAAGAGVWGTVSRRTLAALLVASLSTPEAADRTLEVARSPVGTAGDESFPWDLPD